MVELVRVRHVPLEFGLSSPMFRNPKGIEKEKEKSLIYRNRAVTLSSTFLVIVAKSNDYRFSIIAYPYLAIIQSLYPVCLFVLLS